MDSYCTQIRTPELGNDSISIAIATGEAYCAARLGSTELAIVDFWDRCRIAEKKDFTTISRWVYFQSMQYRGWRGSGVFPEDPKVLDRFALRLSKDLGEVDELAVWYNHHEDRVIEKYAPQARLFELTGLEPYYHSSPWSQNLRGKRVLVVHPFAESIKKQYEQARGLLFSDANVLPEFELKTVKSVQSLLLSPPGLKDWFDALKSMEDQISALTFDVAIVGAGAYGLPLSVFIRSLGKVAIHMGGATQILFGIKGRRWESHPTISKMFNSHWVRPTSEETPSTAHRQEKACYW